MTKHIIRHSIIWLIASAIILLSGCNSPSPQGPTTASPTPQATMTGTPPVLQPTGTVEPGNDSPALSLPGLVDNIPTRTPGPTATPDVVAEAVVSILQETGLSGKTLLQLKYADWINLVFSLLYVVGGYLIGTWLIRWLFPRLVQRTKTVLDDRLLEASGNELRWLVIVLILQSSTKRLTFINAGLSTTLLDIYFFLILFLLIVILFRLINLAASEAENRVSMAGRKKEGDALIILMGWVFRLAVIILSVSISLTHFGVNITGFAVFLGILGLAFSLAGRDVLSDMISGAIILIDRPYRIGDRIDLPSLNSWGDVYEIGMRSTKVLTIENRMVVVPNSQIAKNQIVNYNYPEPSLYDESKVMVSFDNDIDQVGDLIADTIRSVDGVMPDREVYAWLLEFRENWAIFTTGWWIKSYEQKYSVRNAVNRAIARVLREAGVVMPYLISDLKVDMDSHGTMPLQNNGSPMPDPGHDA